MLCLGLDTALGACSVAWVGADGGTARLFEFMSTGHAERLAPMADELMRTSERRFADIGRIAVTTGPGTFTGQRIGLAFARGLALALKVPCVGVTTLSAMAEAVRANHPGHSVLVAADARRGEAYVQAFGPDGAALDDPALLTLQDAASLGASLPGPVVLAGTASAALAAMIPDAVRSDVMQPDAFFVASIGQRLDPDTHPPVPLYLRAPDAKLPGPLKPLPTPPRRREA